MGDREGQQGDEMRKRKQKREKNKVLFVLPIKPFFELDIEWERKREVEREEIERVREWC